MAAVFISAGARAQAAAAPVPSQESIACLADLEAISPFLLDNDAGARANLALAGAAHIDAALEQARGAAVHATSLPDCNNIINRYLQAWRGGHLWVNPTKPSASAANAPATAPTSSTTAMPGAAATAPAADPRAPTLTVLSPATLLLTLPSFHLEYRAAIAALLKRRRTDLLAHPQWIIDVRRNEGGGDASYSALLPWLAQGGMAIAGVEFMSTPANIAGLERLCRLSLAGADICASFVTPLLAAMRAVPAGQFVAIGDLAATVSYEQPRLEPQRPAQVAILVDRDCASACEQFLLTARQSYRVKLLGRHTAGALDYSNLVPHALPSGRLELWYAISRSARIPNLPVDGIGVLPDLYLPAPADDQARADEIERVRRWLEGGSLAPLTDGAR